MELTESIGGGSGTLPSLVSLPHPLVSEGREVSYAAFLPGETLGAYIERTGITIARGAIAAWHNGKRVPDHLWDRLIPRTGDHVVIRGRAEGGGGGNKVLRTVALVVVAIASVYTAGAAGGAAGWAAGLSSSTGIGAGAWGAAAAAAISIGGSILVGAMIPEVNP
jgi:hypothetical protein